MEDPKVTLLFAEYQRLANQCDSHVRDLDGTFKNFAVVGLVFAWPPIMSAMKNAGDRRFLLLGFLAILTVVAVLLTRDLMKMCVIFYGVSQMRKLEGVLETDCGIAGLRFARDIPQWSRRSQRWIARGHGLFIALTVGLFPFLYLHLQDSPAPGVVDHYDWIYLCCAVLGLSSYAVLYTRLRTLIYADG